MIGRFIYVFDENTRDSLLSKSYKMITADTNKNIYVFENKFEMKFDMSDIKCVYSDTLTF